jgi:hypothetical protein
VNIAGKFDFFVGDQDEPERPGVDFSPLPPLAPVKSFLNRRKRRERRHVVPIRCVLRDVKVFIHV